MTLQANSFCIDELRYVGINKILMDGPDYCTGLVEYLSHSGNECLSFPFLLLFLFLLLSQTVIYLEK